MTAIDPTPTGPELHVLFRVGGAEYAFPARDVAQLESFGSCTPVPGAARHLAGIIQVRGRVIPVVDLRARFGLNPAPPTLDSRVVVALMGDRRVGLLVDAAREVVRLDPAQVHPPPPMVVAESGGFVRAIAHLGARVLMLVDLQKLIGEELPHGE